MKRLFLLVGLVPMLASCGSDPDAGTETPAPVAPATAPAAPGYTVGTFSDGTRTYTCVGNGAAIDCPGARP